MCVDIENTAIPETLPVFDEPNRLVCQINNANPGYQDYASIKTPEDLQHAINLCRTSVNEYQIVDTFQRRKIVYTGVSK